jgi:ATP-binding cassette subfamily B protein
MGGSYRALVLIAGAMILVGLLGTAISGLSSYLYTRLSGPILFALREDLYAHLQRLAPDFYARRHTGDVLSRLDGDVAEIQRFAVDGLFSSISNLLGLLGAVTLMVALSGQLASVLIVLIPIEGLFLRVMRRGVERCARRARERSADLSSFLVETLPAMKFIQAVAAEAREAQRLHGLGERCLSGLLRLQVVQFATSAVPGTLTSWSRAGVFLLGGYWVIEGNWPLGSLIAFSTYLSMATGPVQGLLGLYVAAQRARVSLERVMELRRAAPSGSVPDHPRALPLPLRGEIRLERVTFVYPERQQPVLAGASAVIPAGRKVALSGPSGAGKTTLIDLVLRYHDPQEGRILLDGTDLRELDPAELRRHIAVVSQDIVLFRGSIASNIRYARPEATDEQVADAAARARLAELAATLPQGLDTPVGERGARLSGGSSSAWRSRALLQDPAILILDEATSAVDEATEAEVIAEQAPTAAFLMAQVFTDRWATSAAQMAAAIDWLVEQQAQVINLSLGLRQDRSVLRLACERATRERIVVCAASPARGDPTYPGVLRMTGDARCQAYQFSCLGTRHADFAGCVHAPGAGIAGASVGCAHMTGHLAGGFLVEARGRSAPAAGATRWRGMESVCLAQTWQGPVLSARSAVDPLSGNGIFQALSSAFLAPAVVNTLLRAPGQAALAKRFYQERLDHLFLRFARIGRDFGWSISDSLEVSSACAAR